MMIRFLAACRYLLVVPVIGCVLLTLGVVLMGAARIVTAGINVVQAGDVSAKAAKTMSLAVIEIIDLFLGRDSRLYHRRGALQAVHQQHEN